jgi:hypothetical protein
MAARFGEQNVVVAAPGEQDCRGTEKEVQKHAVTRPPLKAVIHFPW